MKKSLFYILLSFFFTSSLLSQNFTDSNLPIIVINTDGGVPIPDEPKVLGTMKVIFRPDGSRNFMTDIDSVQFLNYNGRIGIEKRGSTSQEFFDKKPYSLTTLQPDNVSNNNVSIFGMPEENDWVLNSLAFDATCMRDVLAYDLSRQLGRYASRCVYCEVVVNGNYCGLYVFMEKIKVDKERVNIEKMDQADISQPEVTGGYITKADKMTGGDPMAWSMQSYTYDAVEYIHHYPKPEDIKPAQNNYIRSVFMDLENKAHQGNESILNGFPSIIDIPSFIDFMIVGEFSSNVDVYQLSTYFHKDRGGKLCAGPVWDYNLAFGFDYFGDRSRTDVWQFDNWDNDGSKFWLDLFENDLFRCYFAKRWEEVSGFGKPFSYLSVCGRMNEIDTWISEAIIRDNQRWGNLYSHNSAVAEMKTWIQQRIAWMNQNVGSSQNCLDVELPPLVISKIHYHPEDFWELDSDQLEFIEITNNSEETVDLSGIYFRELGVSYIFPNNAHVEGGQTVLLASDSSAFFQRYGMHAFGQYQRTLSNKSQNLVLADAWGNVIDEVCYHDSEPWPTEADGDGFYLQLIDLNSDNSLAENWTIGDDVTGIQNGMAENDINICPNPAMEIISVCTPFDHVNYQIMDMIGHEICTGQSEYPRFDINLHDLCPGLYLLRLRSHETVKVIKILKQ